MVTEKELIERFWKTNWWKYLNHSQVVELTDYINSKPQPQQKEQFSRDEVLDLMRIAIFEYFNNHGKTTDQLLTEYLNSKTKPI